MLSLAITVFSAVPIHRRVAKPVTSVKEQATARNEKQTDTKKE